MNRVESERIKKSVEAILLAISEDPQREGLRATPKRVAEMYKELFSGVGVDPADALTTTFKEDGEGAVAVRDVHFASMCEHHLLPFFGKAHIGYVPRGRVAGASKLVRALEVVAHRPQLQERMTSQLADAIYNALKPDGVAVVLEAEHLCMVIRGVKKPGSTIVTSAVRGDFSSGPITRDELLKMVYGR